MIQLPASIPWRAIGAGVLATALFSAGWAQRLEEGCRDC